MEITWYGRACFRLKGRDATVITDPVTFVGEPKLDALYSLAGWHTQRTRRVERRRFRVATTRQDRHSSGVVHSGIDSSFHHNQVATPVSI